MDVVWRRTGLILLLVLGALLVAGWLLDDWRVVALAVLGLSALVALWVAGWRRRRRRRRRRAAPREHIPRAVRQAIYRRDGFACRYCGRRRGHAVKLELDHFFPVARGGTDDPGNLVTACFDCNRAKGARVLLDEAALRRFIAEREVAVAAMNRADWRRVVRRDLLLTVAVAMIVLLTYLALVRWVW
jgi:hypothetical protein